MSSGQWRSAHSTKPPTGVAVHLYDTDTNMEVVGYYDGYAYHTYLGNDCTVTKWKPIDG